MMAALALGVVPITQSSEQSGIPYVEFDGTSVGGNAKRMYSDSTKDKGMRLKVPKNLVNDFARECSSPRLRATEKCL
eukprot:CAMPEP_0201896594 /NCGR_PEP_ID=MMETSP0902-20130614/44952_1 /ASSEMBLY_ACC=CAM_ASM_000551 /TAXON_ID=420261 /ORGANISM="Thalassiosira antarctica, Strain CCMP982" /LENGTH=76 /DNA_ID=CAMNT_0048429233 /DNA_START=246 /DNA_END=475 /DNA_ORIENTATION=+